jgi:hypothetical protein
MQKKFWAMGWLVAASQGFDRGKQSESLMKEHSKKQNSTANKRSCALIKLQNKYQRLLASISGYCEKSRVRYIVNWLRFLTGDFA